MCRRWNGKPLMNFSYFESRGQWQKQEMKPINIEMLGVSELKWIVCVCVNDSHGNKNKEIFLPLHSSVTHVEYCNSLVYSSPSLVMILLLELCFGKSQLVKWV